MSKFEEYRKEYYSVFREFTNMLKTIVNDPKLTDSEKVKIIEEFVRKCDSKIIELERNRTIASTFH